MAHRLIFELVVKKDIRKYQLDHTCENRVCCNPNHMDVVKAKVNCRRRNGKRRKTPDKIKNVITLTGDQ